VTQIAVISYLTSHRPYINEMVNDIEIFNELTILSMSYMILLFTDFLDDPELKLTLGFIYCGIIMTNMLINIIVIVISTLVPLFKTLK
jgi:hypothetical protein